MGDYWPERLGASATRPFEASLKIPDGAKRVWMAQWVLDTRGAGCWLNHEHLGERLGMTARSVETYRLRLEAHGLMVRLKEPGVRAHGWRSTLPRHCVMRSQRPSPAEVKRFRTYLDLHVGEWANPARDGPETRTDGSRNPQPASLKPAPVRVSGILSTAFDSPDSHQASTAFPIEGSRDVTREARDNAVEKGEPRNRNSESQAKLTREERSRFLRTLEKLPPEHAAMLRRIAGV